MKQDEREEEEASSKAKTIAQVKKKKRKKKRFKVYAVVKVRGPCIEGAPWARNVRAECGEREKLYPSVERQPPWR